MHNVIGNYGKLTTYSVFWIQMFHGCQSRSKMKVGRLQLFARFCNFAGLFPFRLVLDGETGKFKRFDCRWLHPASVWFAVVLIGQLSFTILIICVNLKFFMASNSLVYRVSMLMDVCNFLIVSWAPRLFLFHIRKVEKTIHSLIYFDRMLVKCHRRSSNIRRRIIIYIIICLVTVLLSKILLDLLLFKKRGFVIVIFVDGDHHCHILHSILLKLFRGFKWRYRSVVSSTI